MNTFTNTARGEDFIQDIIGKVGAIGAVCAFNSTVEHDGVDVTVFSSNDVFTTANIAYAGYVTEDKEASLIVLSDDLLVNKPELVEFVKYHELGHLVNGVELYDTSFLTVLKQEVGADLYSVQRGQSPLTGLQLTLLAIKIFITRKEIPFKQRMEGIAINCIRAGVMLAKALSI